MNLLATFLHLGEHIFRNLMFVNGLYINAKHKKNLFVLLRFHLQDIAFASAIMPYSLHRPRPQHEQKMATTRPQWHANPYLRIVYRVFVFLLLGSISSRWAAAQPATGAVTVRATEYNTDPGGLPLGNFKARVEVRPTMGSAYTIEQDCSGDCVFERLPKGSTLVFSAAKQDEIKYAVGTYDLVLLNQHILKVSPLNHPALLIAADANCDSVVNAKDIVAWRRLVLDLVDTTICRYWTLLDATAILPSDPLNAPLPFEVTLRNYDGRAREVHFLAIKNGNLNVVFPPPRATAPSPGTLAAAPQPNPTPGPVWFGVYLPEPATVHCEVFDTGGRRVYADYWPGQAGAQQLELPATALPIAGIYFWRITTENGAQASGKMVRM